MLTEQLRHGMILQLSQDVLNPKPDRRAKYDWTKQAVLKAGTRFTVYEADYTVGNNKVHWFVLNRDGTSIAQHSPLYFHVLSSCEAVEETIEDLIGKGYGSWAYEEIVKALLTDGRLTLDEVRGILAKSDE